MSIQTNLDILLAQRKVSLKELAQAIGITPQNLSILKNGHAKAIKFSTLEAICEHLQCQPGDLFTYEPKTISSPVSAYVS